MNREEQAALGIAIERVEMSTLPNSISPTAKPTVTMLDNGDFACTIALRSGKRRIVTVRCHEVATALNDADVDAYEARERRERGEW